MTRQNLPGLFADAGTSPFFRSLQNEMNQMLEKFRGTQPDTNSDGLGALYPSLFPALDVAETNEAIEITAEVPGVEEDDLDISISGGVLTLKGEKSSKREEKEDDYYLSERRYGSFRRQIPLGFTPDDGDVDAKFDNGVLTLRIAKPAEEKAKVQKISISKS